MQPYLPSGNMLSERFVCQRRWRIFKRMKTFYSRHAIILRLMLEHFQNALGKNAIAVFARRWVSKSSFSEASTGIKDVDFTI